MTSIMFHCRHQSCCLHARCMPDRKSTGGKLRGSAPEPPGIYRIRPPAERERTRMWYRAAAVAEDRALLARHLQSCTNSHD